MKQQRREAHTEAMRAAARLAFSAAVLGGCSPAPTVAQAPVREQQASIAPPASASPTVTAAPEPEPTASQAAPGEAACDELVDRTFPRDNIFTQVDPKTAPSGLVACCEDRVLAHYHVGCCTFLQRAGVIKWTNQGDLDGTDREHQILRACSPWGPPMPPAARMSARRSRRIGGRRVPRKSVGRTLSLREQARRHAPAVPDLPLLRDAAIATWRARMVNEHGSARVFEGLARQMERAGLVDDDVVAGFANEERHHGVLCGAVVEALGGEARAEVSNEPPYPIHRDAASPLEATLRDVLSVCCLSETVAVALIGAERLEMPRGPLRELLTEIYADEVGHARFGWRLLEKLASSLDAATKEALGRYLALAFGHLEEHELAHLPENSDPPPEGRAYGLCNGRDARALFYDVVTSVIVPGLEQHGIPAARAWQQRSR